MKGSRGTLGAAAFSLAEHIPAARWCLALAVIAFAAAVSVCKYIDLADTAAFSSFETLFMVMTDTVNIVFIYLPAYLFTVCGIMFSSGFGGIEILRCGSRQSWLAAKLITYAVNTVIFFAVVVGINYAVCSRSFYFSGAWSSGFVGFRVMMGNPASDFAAPPVPTLIGASASALLFYLFCGIINMLASIIFGRESAALFISLLAGIALGALNSLTYSNDLESQIIRCAVLAAASLFAYSLCLAAFSRRDMTRRSG